MSDGQYYEVIYPLADVKCKKDSGFLLQNAILPKIDGGVNRVVSSQVKFTEQDGKRSSVLVGLTYNEATNLQMQPLWYCTPESFISGDLAFLCMIMGKEGYEGDWCYLCDLFHTDWQELNHKLGTEWTTQGIETRHTENVQSKAKWTHKGGVKERPYFRSVKNQNVFFSVLHAMMGLGNNCVDYLVDYIEQHIENLPQEEVGLKNSVTVLMQRLAECRAACDAWESTEEGKQWKGIGNKISYRISCLESGKGDLDKYRRELAQLRVRQLELNEIRKPLADEVDGLVNELSDVKEEIKRMRANRKSDDTSLYTAVDEILEKHKIFRSAYHSGQINGVGIKLLMDNAESIMDDVEELMLANLLPESDKTKSIVKLFCNDVKLFLVLWDDAFAAVHKSDPSKEDCNDAQAKIDLEISQLRRMCMSVTPKGHGMEDHVVRQMRQAPGGIVRLIEHWVERYHQIGFKYDDK